MQSSRHRDRIWKIVEDTNLVEFDNPGYAPPYLCEGERGRAVGRTIIRGPRKYKEAGRLIQEDQGTDSWINDADKRLVITKKLEVV